MHLPNPRNPSRKIHRGQKGRFVPQPRPKIPVFNPFPRLFRPRTILSFTLLLSAATLVYLFKDLPSPTRLTRVPAPSSTQILDRNGVLLYNIFSDQNRTPVHIKDLPDHVWQSTIAIEDKNFFNHQGLALTSIIRASLKNVRYFICRVSNRNCALSFQGGSTITQQLVKTALLTPERTIRRKIREVVLTLAVESVYSKEQILEMYLNQVPYGGTSYGIESAARTYFGKKAVNLTLEEAALLSGLPAAPTRYSPFGAHPELARIRQSQVLQRMTEDKYITATQMETAQANPLVYAPPQIGIRAPHFVLYVKDLLVQKYGEQVVEKGGLKVTTSLDISLQDSAQTIVASEVAKLKKAKVGNAAALVTAPKTGEILAMVGSHDYFDKASDGNVNVTLRPRQPGSSIKPLNYALALELNLLTPASLLLDLPTCFAVSGQKSYCPDNYDRSFHGPVQVRFALGNSYNIPAVKTLVINNLKKFIDKAGEFGITTFTNPDNYGLSLTLGGGEIKMTDMAVAFGVFANSGTRVDLHPILKVEDPSGKILEEFTCRAADQTPGAKNSSAASIPSVCGDKRVISPETAYLVSHILLDNNARSAAFGSSSFLNVPLHPEVSVKTGTTNDKRDNWTIGFNSDRLVAVWVGNNDNSPLGAVASGITGASPIWNKIITSALKNQKSVWPIQPEGVVGRTICAVSGLLPPDPANPASCLNSQFRFEYFKKDNLPSQSENLKRDIPVDKTTGIQATSKTLPENIEIQNHSVVTDLLGSFLCVDCAGQPTDYFTIRVKDFIKLEPTPTLSP